MADAKHTPAYGPVFDSTGRLMASVACLDAESMRRYAAAKWPKAMQSPLADAMGAASAMALLESSDADAAILRAEAMGAAEACLRFCGGWTVETLSANVESVMGGELDEDDCDDIARAAIAQATGSAA